MPTPARKLPGTQRTRIAALLTGRKGEPRSYDRSKHIRCQLCRRRTHLQRLRKKITPFQVRFRAWFFFQWDLNGSTITKKESGRAMKSPLQKKRIRSCNEVFIAKKKNQVESLLPIPNGAQSKLKWSSDFTIQNRNGARSSIWTPFHPNHNIPTAPGPSLQRPAHPNNHATTTPWSFFVCSMFPIPNQRPH
jgi:hypothetical protein